MKLGWRIRRTLERPILKEYENLVLVQVKRACLQPIYDLSVPEKYVKKIENKQIWHILKISHMTKTSFQGLKGYKNNDKSRNILNGMKKDL